MGIRLGRRALFFLLGSLLFVPAAAAKDADITIGEQPPLFSPSNGIVNSVVERALELRGYNVRFRWLPIGRMLSLLQSEPPDLYITPSNTPGQDRSRIPFLEARGVFFYKKARFPRLEASRLEDLAGKRVASVVNTPLSPLFTKAGIVVDEGPMETLFAKLDSGRVDFAATADVGGLLEIHREFAGREAEFAFTDFSYMRIQAGLYASDKPDDRAVLEDFRAGLAQMRADGSLERMLRSFFGDEHWRRVRILE